MSGAGEVFFEGFELARVTTPSGTIRLRHGGVRAPVDSGKMRPSDALRCDCARPRSSRRACDMTNFSSLSVLALALLLAFPAGRLLAEDDESLREQRRAAHKERQQARNERSKKIREATKAFKAFARDLEREYAEKARELDTAFELERVELEAKRDAEIATAEAEYQQKMTGLFVEPGTRLDEATIERLQGEWKTYADELFGLKKEFAELSHGEEMAKERELIRIEYDKIRKRRRIERREEKRKILGK